MIYDAFLRAGGLGIPRDKEGILVDEQFGGDIIRDAINADFLLAASGKPRSTEKYRVPSSNILEDSGPV
jgi:hypothetical protein